MGKKRRTKKQVKRIIMLTVIAICVILIIVGCENGKTKQNNPQSGDLLTSGDEVMPSGENENIVEPVQEVYKYNESGKIIIAMYHKFADEETDEWTRSYDNFYKDLEYLYEHGYRTVSLNDYINNDMKVPVGCTPIILTFDDGYRTQFSFIRDENDNLVVNPKTAVGIMEKFYEEHPDFGLNGTFYINNTGYFGNEGTRKEKLEYLISKGFEIGNHTDTHINFSQASSAEEVINEVGPVAKEVYELTGYKINSLALPYGSMSKTYEENIIKGVYEGFEYENKVLLLVGANPALSPTNENVNLYRLPRVRARGGNKEVECDLYWWLDQMEKSPNSKYYRLENETPDNT